MKVFASFRYQLADQKRGILTYYGVLLGFYVLFEILFVVAAVGEDVNGSTTNGITAVTAVYVFVASLCSFKDNLGCPCRMESPGAARFWPGFARRGPCARLWLWRMSWSPFWPLCPVG